MKYIAAREGFGGYIYFQNNIDDSPKWSCEKSKAMRFDIKDDALSKSDKTKIYTGSIFVLEVEQ
jgi:hypothetical protein